MRLWRVCGGEEAAVGHHGLKEDLAGAQQTYLLKSVGYTVGTVCVCSVYVDAEEKQLRETMEALVKEETWQPMEDAQQTNVLKSSSELFAVIKRSLTRCSKFVSTGAAMLQLCNAFQVGNACIVSQRRVMLHHAPLHALH